MRRGGNGDLFRDCFSHLVWRALVQKLRQKSKCSSTLSIAGKGRGSPSLILKIGIDYITLVLTIFFHQITQLAEGLRVSNNRHKYLKSA